MAYQGFSNLFNQPTHQIIIYSFSINTKMVFPAIITNFSDSFKSNWNKTSVLGRMDPIATFKDTTRTINLAFDSPAYNEIEAATRMADLQNLTNGLYPVYQDIKASQKGTSILSSPPMFRIKFANLIQNATKPVDLADSDDALNGGLLGYLDGFDYKPELDAGVFIVKNYIIPKLVKVSLNFNVLHEHGLGSRIGDIGPEVKVVQFPRLAFQATEALVSELERQRINNEIVAIREEQEAASSTAGVPVEATTTAPEGATAQEPTGAAAAGRQPAGGVEVDVRNGAGKSSQIGSAIANALSGQGDSTRRGGSP